MPLYVFSFVTGMASFYAKNEVFSLKNFEALKNDEKSS